MTDKHQDQTAEVNQLRAKVEELERELEKQRQKAQGTTTSQSREKDLLDQVFNTGAALTRAVALAGVEQTRLIGTAFVSVADTISDKNRLEEKGSKSDLVRDLPKDIYSGALNGIQQLLKSPGKVIDRIQESYKETKES